MQEVPQDLKADISLLKSKDGYLRAGIPNFEGLFGRDSAISALQLLDFDSNIARSTLIALANTQGRAINETNGEEPGKIVHEFYPQYTDKDWFVKHKGMIEWLDIGVPVYFSVDSTPLFLILYCEYYKKSNDLYFVKSLMANAKAAAKWIDDYGVVKFFLRYTKSSSPQIGLMSQSWKDGFGNLLERIKSPVAMVEVQGYAYLALKSLSQVLMEIDPSYDISAYIETADKIKEKLQKFWYTEDQYYALGLDGNDVQVRRITSNPGQLLMSGILEKENADLVVRRLFQPDLFTPYGIRTHSMLEDDFDQYSYQRGTVWPHDNWMIAQGLRKMGYIEEYKKIRNAILLAYSELKCSPEFYGVDKSGKLINFKKMSIQPCIPQAWTAGTLVDLFEKE